MFADIEKRLFGKTADQLSPSEKKVIKLTRERKVMATNASDDFMADSTTGQRLADGIARIGGSWSFIIAFLAFLLIWVGLNAIILVSRAFDPYPFIFLNLLLSMIAAIQAPIIMMSQKRQEEKDRLRSSNDYQVNLKAELEIRHLHEKIDHLITRQWQRLAEIQQVQLELLQDQQAIKPKRPKVVVRKAKKKKVAAPASATAAPAEPKA